LSYVIHLGLLSPGRAFEEQTRHFSEASPKAPSREVADNAQLRTQAEHPAQQLDPHLLVLGVQVGANLLDLHAHLLQPGPKFDQQLAPELGQALLKLSVETCEGQLVQLPSSMESFAIGFRAPSAPKR
jgi:hypothetical protein